MLFSYGYGQQRNRQLQNMQANWPRFWFPCRRGNTAQCTLPDGVHWWLDAKPLDAAIRRLPVPYCPGSHHGQQFEWNPKTLTKHNFYLAFLRKSNTEKLNNFGPKTDPLLISPMQWAAFKCETLLYKLKSSATFWAIKLSQQKKIQKVINLEQSSRKPGGHIWIWL